MTTVARLLLLLPSFVLIAASAAQAQPFNFHQQLTGAAAGALFGKAVSVDGDIAVVGSPGEETRRGRSTSMPGPTASGRCSNACCRRRATSRATSAARWR